MKNNETKICKLCGSGDCTKVLIGRPDYEYGIIHAITYWKCNNKNCGLVFALPIPSPQVISEFYNKYSTHSNNANLPLRSFIARLSRIEYLKYLKSLFIGLNLSNLNILDYGCGNGNLLQDLKKIGISNLNGYDMDTVACSFARNQGLNAFSDVKNIELNAPYDFIFMNHVVEHLVDPSSDIAELSQFLSKNGKIVIRTPNSNSFLAKFFRNGWRGWETPRHLNIFNNQNILFVFKDMIIEKKYSSNLMFSGIFNGSFHSNFFRFSTLGKLLRKFIFVILFPFALLLNYIFSSIGEEICIIAKKTDKT